MYIFQVPSLERIDARTGDGTPLRGPEVKDGERWQSVLQTCPPGTYLLGVDLFSDAVMAGAVSRYSKERVYCRSSFTQLIFRFFLSQVPFSVLYREFPKKVQKPSERVCVRCVRREAVCS